MVPTSMVQFLCSNCGNRFEGEPSDSVLCPKCFWSTSVKRMDRAVSPSEHADPGLSSPSNPPRFLIMAGSGLFVVILLGVGFLAVRHLQKQNEFLRTIETQNSKVISSEAPELALSPRDRKILKRKVSLAPPGELSENEKEILAHRVPVHSRLARGLLTPPWDELQFDHYLKGQESYFKVSLEWSYRRKLTRLFKEHYLPAVQAFEAKNYLKARDEWIRSLAFPIYHGDVRRHRGVVLTMLRPYVNDTLSKIGMMNVLLTEKEGYGVEEKILSTYKNLYEALQKPAWEEARALILELQKELGEIGNNPKVLNPPPLPKEAALIDPDIREVLLVQTAPTESGVRDWELLRQDVAEKQKVVKSHVADLLEEIRKQYDEALLLIEGQNWERARQLLEKIDYPDAFAEDAHAKIKILSRSQKTPPISPPASLDSGKDSS